MTVEDVIFSFEALKKDGRPNMRRTYALVKSVQKTGERSVKFTLGGDYNRETVMIIALMPVLQKKWWQPRSVNQTMLDIPPTSGPYKIASIDPGRRIIYQRDPGYWGQDLLTARGHFNADRVIYDYYRDDTIAMEAFKSGNLDLRREFDAGSWSQNYDFPAVQDGRVQMFTIPHGRPERTKGFMFNTRRAPFDDIRVRKAFNLMFDADWVNKNLFHGQYKRINSYFPNSELAANNTAPPALPRRESLREADKLLKEAGWNVNNGQRMKDGKPLSFEIILSAPEDKKIALSFTNVLEKMGIKPGIRVLDNANYIGRLNEYDFDMTLYYWTNSLSPGTEQILYWGCQAAKEPARWNYPGICDPAIDALSNQIANARDRATLVTATRTLDRKLIDGVYMIPLFYAGNDYAAAWKPLRKPDTPALYGMVLETWWLDPPAPPKSPVSIQKSAQPAQ
jgi:microcin C transport system substrate-binding protein